MELNEYQRLARRTNNMDTPSGMIENGVLGMCGEAGECADILKKYFFQGHDLDRNAMLEEVDDVLWYIALTASGLGVTLEEVAQKNLTKLKVRYPEGFDPERSVNRPEYADSRKHQINTGFPHLFCTRNKMI